MNHAIEDVEVLVFEIFQYKFRVIFPILFNVSQTQAPDTFPQLNTHKNCFKGLRYYKSITILPQINKFHLFRKFKFLQGKKNQNEYEWTKKVNYFSIVPSKLVLLCSRRTVELHTDFLACPDANTHVRQFSMLSQEIKLFLKLGSYFKR